MTSKIKEKGMKIGYISHKLLQILAILIYTLLKLPYLLYPPKYNKHKLSPKNLKENLAKFCHYFSKINMSRTGRGAINRAVQ